MEETICDKIEDCKSELGNEFRQSQKEEFCNGNYKRCAGYDFLEVKEEHKEWKERFYKSFKPNPEKLRKPITI